MKFRHPFTGTLETGEMRKEDDGTYFREPDDILKVRQQYFPLLHTDLFKLFDENAPEDSTNKLIEVSHFKPEQPGHYVNILIPNPASGQPHFFIGYRHLYISDSELERFTQIRQEPSSKESKDKESATLDKANQNFFRLKGDMWHVRFNKKETYVKDFKRIRYLVQLLQFPHKPFHVLELMSLIDGKQPDVDALKGDINDQQPESQGFSFSDHSIDGLTHDDKKKLEEILIDAWDGSQRADNDHKPEMDRRYNEAKRHVKKAHGISVKDTPEGPIIYFSKKSPHKTKASENARTNVQKQLKAAIKELAKDLPDLVLHLKPSIITGSQCVYDPTPADSPELRIYSD